jgi:hypothetical protein
VPAWVLTEDEQHAVVVVAADDIANCCAVLDARGSDLGCVFVGQAALRRLAAARLVTLT